MSNQISPEAAGILSIMLEEVCLPANWDTSGLWLTSAQQLAQFLADHRGKVALEDAAILVGIGGILLTMATREREASAAAGAFLRGEGNSL